MAVEQQQTGEQFRARAMRLAPRWLGAAVVAAAVFLLVLFLVAALRRLRFPFEVEWIESGMMVSVLRILHGQPLYAEPTVDYVPFLYAPLFYYIAAAMSHVTGATLAALRMVSILSTLGSCAVIFAFVFTETRNRIAASAGAGLFLGCYAISAQFYDIGRVDALFVFLLTSALFAQRRGYPVLAALLWALTFQTKQTVLPLAVIILCAEWHRPRKLIAALGTFAVAVTASIVLLNHATHGWYNFYIFTVGRGLPVLWRQAALFLPRQIFAPFGIALLLLLASLVLRPPSLQDPRVRFFMFTSFALVCGIWFVVSHRGASLNAYIPLYAWVAILFGVAIGRLLKTASDSSRLPTIVLAGALVQLVALTYNPGQFIPSRAVCAVRAAFIDQLRAIPGDVYVPFHTYDAVLAGKTPHAEFEAAGAVIDAPRGKIQADFTRSFKAQFQNHAYSAIVVDDITEGLAYSPITDAYPVHVPSVAEPGYFLTSQPHWILYPCGEQAQAAAVRPRALVDASHCTPH